METILAILVGGYIGNIPVKFKSNWPKGLEGDNIYSQLFTFVYFMLRQPVLFKRAEPF